MLFHVTGSGVLLCGAIHFLPTGQQLPPSLFAAIADADECFFESDLDLVEPLEFARYPEGETLEQLLPPELFCATSALCERLGLSSEWRNRKPWFVGLTIGVTIMMQAGALPQWGADRQLFNAAKHGGKRRLFLENRGDAMRVFDEAPISEQIARLAFIVSNPDSAVQAFDRLFRAWCIWDTVALAGELGTLLDLSPQTYTALVYDRNRKWLPKILNAVQRDGTAIFTVGALHLAGEHSLQRLLEGYGQTVRSVPL